MSTHQRRERSPLEALPWAAVGLAAALGGGVVDVAVLQLFGWMLITVSLSALIVLRG